MNCALHCDNFRSVCKSKAKKHAKYYFIDAIANLLRLYFVLFSFPQLQYISAAATVDMYSDYKGKQLDDFFDLSLCPT